MGGVNSPVRAFGRVGGTPRFMSRGRGSRLWDADGNEYIDYVGAWGAAILGHAHPKVVAAVQAAAADGLSFGTPTERESQLAQAVRERMPSVERLRLVCSGTEAAMSALRLARAYTGRSGFLKFEGAYHGHADAFLSKAGSGAATVGVPDSAGVPPDVARHARTVPFNDLSAAEAVLRAEADEVGAIIVEPVAANMGVVAPAAGFLEGLRELADRLDMLLVFDEVITGFRLGPGGAQQRFGVRPDLTLLGKVLGGGLPLAAYAGREDVMRLVAPEGPVYQAGTMAGNPVAVAAGLATLRELRPATYDSLEEATSRLAGGLAKLGAGELHVNVVGSLLSVFFTRGPVRSWSDVARSDAQRYASLFHHLLTQRICVAPSPYEAWFVGAAHTSADVESTLQAVDEALAAGPRTAPTAEAAP